MMAGNPNWWSMNGMHPRDYPPSDDHRTSDGQDFPVRSWSQLLLGAAASGGGDYVYSGGLFQQEKKLESWEEQRILNMNNIPSPISRVSDVKQESGYDGFPAAGASSCGRPPPGAAVAASSPTSCITNSIFMNFSAAKNQEQSSEGTSGGVSNKKARVQQSSTQPASKVRKEKLGDRITALHQLVSPFGKTDTASVLSEAIGCIRLLQCQIGALSSPYIRNHTRFGHHGMERGANQDLEGQQPALRSRGLCLVPVSCTHHIATDASSGIDYWPLAAPSGGF